MSGAVLSLLFFMVIMPVASSDGHSEHEFTPSAMAVLAIAWGIILIVCSALANLAKKGENSE